MNLFFERTETESEVVVTYKPYFFYFMLSGIVAWVASDYLNHISSVKTISGFVWLSIFVGTIWRFVSMHKVMNEIRAAMKSGAVNISGSKLSLANPMTVRIPKQFLQK